MSIRATKLLPRTISPRERAGGRGNGAFNCIATGVRRLWLIMVMLFSAVSLALVAVAQTNTNVASSTIQTNQTNATAVADPVQRAAEIRAACIEGRRCVCGKVIKIVPEGLIVESGYTALMEPPFTGAWVIPSGALVNRDPKLIERSEP